MAFPSPAPRPVRPCPGAWRVLLHRRRDYDRPGLVGRTAEGQAGDLFGAHPKGAGAHLCSCCWTTVDQRLAASEAAQRHSAGDHLRFRKRRLTPRPTSAHIPQLLGGVLRAGCLFARKRGRATFARRSLKIEYSRLKKRLKAIPEARTSGVEARPITLRKQ